MATEEATTRSTIDAELAVTNFQHVGGSTATWALSTTMPCPTVVGDDASPARSEGVPLAVTLCEGRGVVDIRSTHLRIGGSKNSKCRQECI